jgi:hypothetical protein
LKTVSPVDLHLNDSDVGLIVVGIILRKERKATGLYSSWLAVKVLIWEYKNQNKIHLTWQQVIMISELLAKDGYSKYIAIG